MTVGGGSNENCPKCGKRVEIDDDDYLHHYSCTNCRIMFGRCDSGKSSWKTGCGEITTFLLFDSYSVVNQKFADFDRKRRLESGDKRDMSLVLDEQRAQFLASQNDEVIIVKEETSKGNFLISLRVPSWMSEEGGKFDLGIDSTMCGGASIVLVCSNCDVGHFYDIMWDNQG